MTVWLAFLRAVNVGKRQMKMAELKALCEELGYTSIKTILASGNVRFECAHDPKAELEAAIDAEPAAKEMLGKLTEQNRFAIAFRTHNMKTEAGRKKKIETFVAMLERGETIYPQGKR